MGRGHRKGGGFHYCLSDVFRQRRGRGENARGGGGKRRREKKQKDQDDQKQCTGPLETSSGPGGKFLPGDQGQRHSEPPDTIRKRRVKGKSQREKKKKKTKAKPLPPAACGAKMGGKKRRGERSRLRLKTVKREDRGQKKRRGA